MKLETQGVPKTKKKLLSSRVRYKLDLPSSVTHAVRPYLTCKGQGCLHQVAITHCDFCLCLVSTFQQWLWGEQYRVSLFLHRGSQGSFLFGLFSLRFGKHPKLFTSKMPKSLEKMGLHSSTSPWDVHQGRWMSWFPDGKTVKREDMKISGSHKNSFISWRWLVINVYNWSWRFTSYIKPKLLRKEHATILP